MSVGRALLLALLLGLGARLAHRLFVTDPPHLGSRVVDQTTECLGVELERPLRQPGPGRLERRFGQRLGRILDSRNFGYEFRLRAVHRLAAVILGGQFFSHLVIDVELLVLALGKGQVVLETGVGGGDLRLRDHDAGGWRRRLRFGSLRSRLLGKKSGGRRFDGGIERLRLLERRRLEGVKERIFGRLGGRLRRGLGNESRPKTAAATAGGPRPRSRRRRRAGEWRRHSDRRASRQRSGR